MLFNAVVMPPLPPFDRIVADGAAGRAVLRDAGFLEQDRFRLLAGGLVGMRQSLFNASITAGRGSGSRRLCRPGFPVNAPSILLTGKRFGLHFLLS